MFKIGLEKRAQKFLAELPPKHTRQTREKLFKLAEDPYPPDSKQLKGSSYRGTDIGEYRIIYTVEKNAVRIYLIGKRNDDDVYRRLKRLAD